MPSRSESPALFRKRKTRVVPSLYSLIGKKACESSSFRRRIKPSTNHNFKYKLSVIPPARNRMVRSYNAHFCLPTLHRRRQTIQDMPTCQITAILNLDNTLDNSYVILRVASERGPARIISGIPLSRSTRHATTHCLRTNQDLAERRFS